MSSNLEAREAAYREAMKSGRLKMFLIFLVCAAPVVASYVSFYFLKPDGRTNYGTLFEPARPLPDLSLRELDGKSYALRELRGKWVLVTFHGAACAAECTDTLFKMRQLRTMQGKDRDRVERAWLITDDDALETRVIREQDGVKLLRSRGTRIEDAFPAEGSRDGHIYLVDPLGNLVLRYPRNADPMKINRDLGRLLKYSRIG